MGSELFSIEEGGKNMKMCIPSPESVPIHFKFSGSSVLQIRGGNRDILGIISHFSP